MHFCICESFSNFMMIALDELIVHLRTSLAQRKLPHWHGGFKTRIAYGHCAEQNNSFRATLLVLNIERESQLDPGVDATRRAPGVSELFICHRLS